MINLVLPFDFWISPILFTGGHQTISCWSNGGPTANFPPFSADSQGGQSRGMQLCACSGGSEFGRENSKLHHSNAAHLFLSIAVSANTRFCAALMMSSWSCRRGFRRSRNAWETNVPKTNAWSRASHCSRCGLQLQAAARARPRA